MAVSQQKDQTTTDSNRGALMTASKEKTVWVGLPAYNEEIAIHSLLGRFAEFFSNRPQLNYKIVVYNDGSKDRTVAVASEWKQKINVEVIGLEQNKGLGEGLLRLIEYAAKNGKPEDFFVLMDCDDTHNPIQIERMLAEHDNGFDIVIASRYRSGATVKGVPGHRVLLSYGAALLFKTLHPVCGVLDYTCGYRSYRVGLLQKALKETEPQGGLVRQKGFSCMVEVLLRLNRLKPRPKIKEIPLQLRYDLKPTASKMDVGGNTFKLLKLLMVWRLKGM